MPDIIKGDKKDIKLKVRKKGVKPILKLGEADKVPEDTAKDVSRVILEVGAINPPSFT